MSDDEDVKARLGKLPKDLDQAYNEIYENNTKDLGDAEKARVDRALIWTRYAFGPWRTQALREVVCFTLAGEKKGAVTAKRLLQLCQHLLVVDTLDVDSTWRFPHASVPEWLERKWSRAEGHSFIVRTCLAYLIRYYEDFESSMLGLRDPPNPDSPLFATRYMQCLWFEHIHAIERDNSDSFDQDLVRLLKEFLGSPMESSTQYQRWLANVEGMNTRWSMSRENLDSKITPNLYRLSPSKFALFAMIHLEFTYILLDWWRTSPIDTTVTNIAGETPLALSTSVRISELLFERGADPNLPFKYRQRKSTPLLGAVKRCNLDMVKLLLKAGAKVDEVIREAEDDDTYFRADKLFAKMKFVNETPGADASVENPSANAKVRFRGASVLIVAARSSTLEVVKYLVKEARADVHEVVQNSWIGSPLCAAARWGRLNVVRFFVEDSKVDPNVQVDGGAYGSVLAAADSLGVIKFLVKEAGAQVNMHLTYGDYGTALAAYAYCGHLDSVKYLVEECGADVNLRIEGRRHTSALEAAKRGADDGDEDCKEVVKYLQGVCQAAMISSPPPGESSTPGEDDVDARPHATNATL